MTDLLLLLMDVLPLIHLGIKVSKTRILLTVTSVSIPGHIVSGDLLPSHLDTPLSAFLFNMLCNVKHVHTQCSSSESGLPLPLIQPSSSSPDIHPVSLTDQSNPADSAPHTHLSHVSISVEEDNP